MKSLGIILLAALTAACGSEGDDADALLAENAYGAIESPRNLRATVVSPTAIGLAWAFAGSKERGFVVEARSGAATKYSRLASLPRNTSKFIHSSLLAGTRYDYRVATIDQRGVLSPYATVNATTPPKDAVPTGPRVIPVLITATDSTPSEVDVYKTTFDTLVLAARNWYSENMGPAYGSETYHYESVRVLAGHYTKKEWEDFGSNGFLYPDGRRTAAGGGCSMYSGAEYELRDLGLLSAAALPALGDENVVYFAVTGGGSNGSCGAGGYLSASEANLLTNTRNRCPTGRAAGGSATGGAADCSSVGVYAHELGHGFGLPHCSDRKTCTGRSIMDQWWEFDTANGATLSAEDRQDLAASKWMFAP